MKRRRRKKVEPGSPGTPRKTAKARLVIHLQSGFRNDSVVVRVNGRKVYDKKGVQTHPSLPYAGSIAVTVPKGVSRVKVSVPSRNVSLSTKAKVARTVYLGFSVSRGPRIQERKQYRRFVYL